MLHASTPFLLVTDTFLIPNPIILSCNKAISTWALTNLLDWPDINSHSCLTPARKWWWWGWWWGWHEFYLQTRLVIIIRFQVYAGWIMPHDFIPGLEAEHFTFRYLFQSKTELWRLWFVSNDSCNDMLYNFYRYKILFGTSDQFALFVVLGCSCLLSITWTQLVRKSTRKGIFITSLSPLLSALALVHCMRQAGLLLSSSIVVS